MAPFSIACAPLSFIRSLKGTHFTGALAQNARADEDIAFPHEIQIAQELLIESVSIIAVQNLDWDVYLFTGAAHSNADTDLDTFLGLVSFALAGGKQIAGAGSYYYSSSGLAIPYRDLDATNKLHVSLVNRNASSKNAGASGYITIRFGVRPV